jgi:hypothetical protein
MVNLLKKLYQSLPVVRELRRLEASLLFQSSQLAQLSNHFRLTETTGIIQALEALKAGNERYRDPKRLLVHGAQYFSQNYEDGMIAEIFRRIGTTSKTFVEVGAGDGTENNTSALLAVGWSGWWIDGDEATCEMIESWIHATPGAASKLKVRHALVSPGDIQSHFSSLGIPAEVDLFSLDIDLDTYHIWKSLRDFRPRVVVVEYNAGFAPDVEWVHAYKSGGSWDGTQVFGASLKAFELLGASHGYSLVGCDITGINAFFVRDDLAGDKFVAPYTAENHYEPARYYLLHRWGHPSRMTLVP